MVEITPTGKDPFVTKTIRIGLPTNDKLRQLAKDTNRSENEVINHLIMAGKVADVGVKKSED